MLDHMKRRIGSEVLDNKVQYLLLVFFLLVGITAGTFTVSNMESAARRELAEYINLLFTTIKYNTIDYISIFINSFLQNAAFFAIITVFSLWMIGIPIVAGVLVVKGFCVGFTVGVLSQSIGFDGFLAIVICTFLPNLVLLPCICKAGVMGVNHSITVFRCRRIPATARDRFVSAKPYFSDMFQVFLVSLVGVAMETFLTPALMMLI